MRAFAQLLDTTPRNWYSTVAMTDFTIQIVEHPSQLVIVLTGDINSEAGGPIRKAYSRVREGMFDSIVFDFAGVRYINSEGIAVFFSLVRDMGESSLKMVFAALTPNLQSIVKVVGLIDYVYLSDSVNSWLDANT